MVSRLTSLPNPEGFWGCAHPQGWTSHLRACGWSQQCRRALPCPALAAAPELTDAADPHSQLVFAGHNPVIPVCGAEVIHSHWANFVQSLFGRESFCCMLLGAGELLELGDVS